MNTLMGRAVDAEMAVEDVRLSVEDLLRHERFLRGLDPAMSSDLFVGARRLLLVLSRTGRRLAAETTMEPQRWESIPGRTVRRWLSSSGGGLMLQEDGTLWLREKRGGPWAAWGRLEDADREVPDRCVGRVPGGPWRLVQAGSFHGMGEKS